MENPQNRSDFRLSGMIAFILVAVGQFVSLVGSSMTGLGLTVWAYETTGSATALALVGFFFLAPMLIISPVAGALVDRSNRKLMMMLSDLAAVLGTCILLILSYLGILQVWHLYIVSAIEGTFQAFQWPAFSAAITTMVPKEQYGRANGLLSLAESGSGIFAPVLAGALLGIVGLNGILTIDIITFFIAIGALLIVHVPQPVSTQVGEASRGSIWKESVFGFWYIIKRPSLLGLQLMFLTNNFFSSIAFTLMAAMVLARTNMNELTLGSVNSAAAIGGVLGGLLMSAWGGPKKKVQGILGGWFLTGLLYIIVMGVGQGLVVWAIASLVGTIISPVINGSSQAIWQAKVAPDVQGRVFSIRRLIAWFVTPLATLVAGPWADYVMEPAMANEQSKLSAVFEPIVGSGPGSGMSVILLICGVCIMLISIISYMVPAIREAETHLSDYDQNPPS
jgi:MFS transporter, DHA3 family, macrolide efflux protein